MVTILALAAAVLYGTADFLGGVASRRASYSPCWRDRPGGRGGRGGGRLARRSPVAGRPSGARPGLAHLVRGLGRGRLGGGVRVCGSAGLIAFYAGFAAAPMSVVAPVAALVSTVLPVGVAVAEASGHRQLVAGGLICLVAIVLVSMGRERPG